MHTSIRFRAPALAVLPLVLLLTWVGAGPATAAVTAVAGSAYGYSMSNVALFGIAQPPIGPTPSVTLPPGGSASPVAASAASGNAAYGPARFFSSGAINVSTQGAPGPTGSVTSSTNIASVNTSGQEVFTAANVASTCTATEASATGSTTITNGLLQTDSGNDINGDGDYTDAGEHVPVNITVPTNPAPNTTYEGHIHINNTIDSFRYVFNEQIRNPDGTITVRAGHQMLLGPTAFGDLVFGQSVCRAESTPTSSTFASVSPARVWDSRFGPGPVGQIGPGQTRSVTVTGVGGVPASGVSAVVLNVTAVNPTAATFITAWPAGETKPLASNLNVPPNDVRPNLVIVKVGAGGQVSFNNDAGNVHLIADVAGWYGAAGA